MLKSTYWRADPKGKLVLWKRVDGKKKDKDGNALVLEEAKLTDDGIPQLWPGQSYHRSVNRYDARGNLIEDTFFDIMGNPGSLACGCHRRLTRYDDKNNAVEVVHLGRNEEPIACAASGAFRAFHSRDSRGNPLETWNLGPNGRPANDREGWAKRRCSYDASGALVHTTLWKADPKGKLVFWKRLDGKHKDKDGNALVLELANLSPNGIPQPVPDAGYYRRVNHYNSQGIEIEAAYFGLEGEPVLLRPHMYHQVLTRYNKNSQMTETAHLDVAGRLTRCNNCGHIRTLWRFDDKGNLIETLRFGPNNRPINGTDGWAKQQQDFDASNKLLGRTYWKADSKGVLTLWKREDDQGRPVK